MKDLTCTLPYVKRMTSTSLTHEPGHPKLVLWDNPEGWGGEGITHMEHNPDGTRSSNSCFSVWGYVQNKHNLESQASKNLAIFSTKEELHSPLENKIELLKIFPDDPHLLLPKGVFSSLTASQLCPIQVLSHWWPRALLLQSHTPPGALFCPEALSTASVSTAEAGS